MMYLISPQELSCISKDYDLIIFFIETDILTIQAGETVLSIHAKN